MENLSKFLLYNKKLFSHQAKRHFKILNQNKNADYGCTYNSYNKTNKNYYASQRRTFSLYSPTASRYRDSFGNRTFYEPNTKGPWYKDPEKKYSQLELMKAGFGQLRTEIGKWREEMQEKFQGDPIHVRAGDTDIVFNFKSQEDLSRWDVNSDSDFEEGWSSANLSLSPTGHGLFSGVIDKTVPKDGNLKLSGWANMSTLELQKSFKRKTCYNWALYTHLVMRIRGDGRRYIMIMNTAGTADISWHDLYTYVLYTRGGPYWQDVKIPFSKFFLSSKGRVQDKQSEIPLQRINNFGITCLDRVNAPFRLEIDYIGVHCDPSHTETFAYEMYRIPDYLI